MLLKSNHNSYRGATLNSKLSHNGMKGFWKESSPKP